MARYTIRTLRSDDFAALAALVPELHGPGDEHLVSRIDRGAVGRLRPRYERPGFVTARAGVAAAEAA